MLVAAARFDAMKVIGDEAAPSPHNRYLHVRGRTARFNETGDDLNVAKTLGFSERSGPAVQAGPLLRRLPGFFEMTSRPMRPWSAVASADHRSGLVTRSWIWPARRSAMQA